MRGMLKESLALQLLDQGHEAGDHHLAVGPPTAGRR